jgi:hypothetical protein
MSELLSEAEAPVKLTPGQIIKEMIAIRDERKRIAERDKELVEIWRGLEAMGIAIGDEMGMKRMSSDDGTATITQETLPQVEDWDALYQYIMENDACHMLQRRVSAAAFRELQDAGIEIPGVVPYVQRKISLRKR